MESLSPRPMSQMKCVHALDVVCRHFRAEHRDDALRLMRSQKSKLSSCNYRLRQKIEKLEHEIANLTATHIRLVSSHANRMALNEHLFNTLKKALSCVVDMNRLL